MLPGRNHIIRKQVLDIYTGTRNGSWQVQNDMRDFYYQKMTPLIVEILDEFDTGNEIIRIDHLTIDLGTITQTDFNEDLLISFKARLSEELQKSLAESTGQTFTKGKNVEKITVEKNETEVLFSFLKTGILPWNSVSSDLVIFEKLVVKKIAESEVFKTRLIDLLKSVTIMKRLVNQFRIPALYGTLAAGFLKPKSKKDLVFFSETIPSFINQVLAEFGLSETVSIEKKIVRELLAVFILNRQSGPDTIAFYRKLTDVLCQVTGQPREKVIVAALKVLIVPRQKKSGASHAGLLSFFKNEALHVFQPGLAKSDHFADLFTSTFFRKNKRIEEAVEKVKKISDQHKNAASKKNPLQVKPTEMDTRQKNLPKTDPEKKSGKTEVPEPGEKSSINTSADKDEWEGLRLENETKITAKDVSGSAELIEQVLDHETKSTRHRETDSAENVAELFVSNAGLVILWNYIPHYLKHLGLVNDSGFISDEAKHRGVHLLQYISTGHTDSPEYETGLSKILCGLDVTEVLETGFTLSAEEKDEAAFLLQAVIKNWGALGTTGNEALRQSFICRPGILIQKSDSWVLRVEQSGIDILLDRLPWSISTIRLSWMKKTIYVEWN
ncbi:MAG: hypothetical protein HYZ14_12500 [Bacteroidetes bacterium]|nr:hypothetical protein [Bacteroidota bacterium]